MLTDFEIEQICGQLKPYFPYPHNTWSFVYPCSIRGSDNSVNQAIVCHLGPINVDAPGPWSDMKVCYLPKSTLSTLYNALKKHKDLLPEWLTAQTIINYTYYKSIAPVRHFALTDMRYYNLYIEPHEDTIMTDKFWDHLEIIGITNLIPDTQKKIQLWRTHHQLKWSTLASSKVSYYENFNALMKGVRTHTTLTRFLAKFTDKKIPAHLVRDDAAQLMQYRPGSHSRFEVHIARNEKEIVAIYENSSFGSCMKRNYSNTYVNGRLDKHPVCAYDHSDIDVIGLWDNKDNMYVARVVTNANDALYCSIYPSDRTGTNGTNVQYLEKWLNTNGYRYNEWALEGCQLKFIDASMYGGPDDCILFPYIDSAGLYINIDFNKAEAWLSQECERDDAYCADSTGGFIGHCSPEDW